MKIKTSELEGMALDWAVAQAIGQPLIVWGGKLRLQDSMCSEWYPSEDWEHCAMLMDSCNVDVHRYDYEQQPFTFKGVAHVFSDCGWQQHAEYGPTRMVAICRAIVAAKLGELVSIPDELVPDQ